MTEQHATEPAAEASKPADPMAGREVRLLNNLLAVLIPEAQRGDSAAIDRVLKILELKRKYAEDAQGGGAGKWRL